MIETASVMATDLVDSTILRVALGEDAATQLTVDLERLTADVVRICAGRIVKHLGDGSLAVFPSAVAALDAAETTQQVARRFAQRRPDIDLQLRVGVSSGDVDRTDDDVYGLAVIEAARLCAAADGGAILASATTIELAAGRIEHRCEPQPPLTLKGLSAPVACSTIEVSDAATTVDLPMPMRRGLDQPFVGRSDLASALHELLRGDEALAAVMIRAEPGMGKTTLLAHVARLGHDAGATVLYGAATDRGGQALQPWPAALEAALSSHTLAELLDLLDEDAVMACRLVPGLQQLLRIPLPELIADSDTLDSLAVALARILERLGGDARPVLVVLDDLHWASGEAVELVGLVLGHVESAQVRFALAWRDTEVDRDHPVERLRGRLRRRGTGRTVDLGGLDRASLRELVPSLDDAGADELLTRTGGNPLFAAQLSQSLVAAKGTLSFASDDELLSVGDVIRSRVEDLGKDATDVLAVAAVIGGEFDLSVLSDVLDHRDVLPLMEKAMAAGLISEAEGRPDALSFVHGVVPEILAEELSGARRARVHVQVADALEARRAASDAVLAHHLLAAGTPEAFRRSVDHVRRAAGTSRDALAFDEATDLLRAAIAAGEHLGLGEAHEVVSLLVDLAEVRYLDGDVEERRALGRRVLAISEDPSLSAEAAISVAGFPQAGRPRPEAEHALRLALDRLPEDRRDKRSELLAVLAYYKAINEGLGEEADLLAREAIELAHRSGSPLHIGEALSSRSFVLTGLPPMDQHRQTLAELDAVIPDVDVALRQRRLYEFLLRQRAPLHLRTGDRPAFERDLATLDAHARRHRAWIPAATVAMWRALLAHGEGRSEDAERHATTMLELGSGEANFVNSYAGLLFAIRRQQRRLAELRDLAETTVTDNPALSAFLPVLALVRFADGDPEGGTSLYEQLARDDFASCPQDVTAGLSLPCLAELCTRIEDERGASVLADRLEPYAGQLLVVAWGVFCSGAADRHRAMLAHLLGRPGQRDVLLQRAVTLETAAGLPAVAAETRMVRARVQEPDPSRGEHAHG